jgi:DNA-3-methyladenine glycosylase II
MAGNVSKKRSGGKSAKTNAGKAAVKRSAAAKPRKRVKRRVKKRAPKTRVATPRYHPGPPIADESALAAAVKGLQALDPETVGAMLAVGGPPPLRWREPGFAGLVSIIVSQQVSVASANAMVARLQAAFSPLDAASVLAAEEARLKACGLSQAKMRALKALAEATTNGLDLAGLAALGAEAAHDALVAVKGVGPWTADLFLLFCLGHPDAFPAGDLALQEAARLALGLGKRPDARKLEQIAERWRPLRGVAARLLWAYYRGVKRRAGVVGQ